jgi:hypothetical protein
VRLLRRMVVVALLAALSIFAPLAEAAKPSPPVTPAVPGLAPRQFGAGPRIGSSGTMTHTYYLPLLYSTPHRILFIGDSFTWSLDSYFPSLAASVAPAQRVVNQVIWGGGYTLQANYTSANLATIANGGWDFVVLQDDLVWNWAVRAEFPIYAQKFNDAIKPTGAQTILYMTWQYENPNYPVPTTNQIAAMYDASGAALGVPVSPVGLAFANARALRPSLELFRSDGLHGNANGFYLVMCTLFATIFGQSPVGATYRLQDVTSDSAQGQWWQIPAGWTMPAADAAFLQQVAWDTVTAYNSTHKLSAAPVSASHPSAPSDGQSAP